MTTITAWIRAELRDRGLRDKDLGDFMGWNDVMTSKVLAGCRRLRAEEFLDVLRFFGIPSPIEGGTSPEARGTAPRAAASTGMSVRRAVKGVPLTRDSAAFVASYVAHGNATKAAIAAGYPAHGAHAAGHRLLRQSEIRKALEDARAIVAEELRVSPESILDHLSAIAFGTMADFLFIDAEGQPHIDIGRANPEQLRAIAEIHTETVLERSGAFDAEGEPIFWRVRKTWLRLRDPVKALERLGKHLFGMFSNNKQAPDEVDEMLASMMAMAQSANAALPISAPTRSQEGPSSPPT